MQRKTGTTLKFGILRKYVIDQINSAMLKIRIQGSEKK